MLQQLRLGRFAEGCAGSNLCIDAHRAVTRARGGRPSLHMPSRMLTLVGGPAGMAVALAALAAPAAPRHAPGGDARPPPSSGGAQYGAPLVRAQPGAARRALLPRGPGAWSSPRACPSSRCASTRRARAPSAPASSSCRRPRPARSCASTSAGSRSAGASSRRGRRARRSRPGATACACTSAGCAATVLARKASAPGRATLTVRAPEPAPAPLPDRRRARLPRQPARTPTATASARARNGYSHQGQDILAAEGMPVVAPVAGLDLLHRLPGARRRLLHRREGRRRLRLLLRPLPEGLDRGRARRRPCSPASRCATSARRATRRGRTCTSRLGRADGGSMRARTPSTRCRCCKSWDVSATPVAARR